MSSTDGPERRGEAKPEGFGWSLSGREAGRREQERREQSLIVELFIRNDNSRSVKWVTNNLAKFSGACMILIITYSRTRDWFYK